MTKLAYFTLIFAVISTIAVAAPYQELPPRAGHVPVYIREGNTPLSEINPKLVEAFPDDESVRNQLQNKTPDAVPEAKDNEAKTKADDNKNETVKADDAKVEEVTASDIAEFDNVKSEKDNIESARVEIPLEEKTE